MTLGDRESLDLRGATGVRAEGERVMILRGQQLLLELHMDRMSLWPPCFQPFNAIYMQFISISLGLCRSLRCFKTVRSRGLSFKCMQDDNAEIQTWTQALRAALEKAKAPPKDDQECV